MQVIQDVQDMQDIPDLQDILVIQDMRELLVIQRLGMHAYDIGIRCRDASYPTSQCMGSEAQDDR